MKLIYEINRLSEKFALQYYTTKNCLKTPAKTETAADEISYLSLSLAQVNAYNKMAARRHKMAANVLNRRNTNDYDFFVVWLIYRSKQHRRIWILLESIDWLLLDIYLESDLQKTLDSESGKESGSDSDNESKSDSSSSGSNSGSGSGSDRSVSWM